MNKKTLFLILLGILACPTGLALAQLGAYGPDINPYYIISNIETAIWMVFALIVVVCFVVAAIMFLTAQGAPEKLNTAKAAVIWGVVGVVVGIIAYSIVAIIGGFLIPNGSYYYDTYSGNSVNLHIDSSGGSLGVTAH